MKRRELIIGASLVALPLKAQAKVTMRLSHPLPAAHHTAKQIQAFADEVKAQSKGEIDVQIFPSEQAAKANENHPNVARGGLEAAASVNFQWGNTIPEMSVTTIPYFFTDSAVLKKFPNSPASAMLDEKLEKRGVKNLMWLLTSHTMVFTSNKPLTKLDDLKGLKIRGLNKLADSGLVAAGAAPSAMAAPEVYQALQSGVLDAAQTDIGAAVSRRFYEVQKNATVASIISAYYHVYVNPAWFSALSSNHKDIIVKAARKIEAEAVEVTRATSEAAFGQLKEKGMILHSQTSAEIIEWKAVLQKPVAEAFLKATPEDGQKLLDLIRKL